MILADKIIEERKKNGWSQEELADKLGVSRQAVSKWESAGSIPDLQRVIDLAGLFGVSTDYLLRDDATREDASLYIEEGADSVKPIRRISMEEANEFLEIKRKAAPVIANAVTMCIISPVILIILVGMSESGKFNITEDLAATLGVISLLLMVAVAVFFFITYGIKASKLEYLENESFETEYGVTGLVKERKHSYEPVFTRGIAMGVVLCILAVVPVLIAQAMNVPGYVAVLFVGLLLVMVGIGVNMIIRVSTIKGSHDALLQEGEFAQAEKRMNKKLKFIAGVYWPLTVAIYLGWSFWTNRWDISWIIWPVAGVLYIAVLGVARLILKDKE